MRHGFAEDLAFVGPRFATLPDDPEAAHPDAVVLPSEEAMLDLLSETLAQTHLPAMGSALRGLRVRRGTRVLWRAASDVCAEAFMYVGQSMGREKLALGFGEKLLSGPYLPGAADYYRFEHDSGSEMTLVRGTCCLYYKVADGACFTCPRTTRWERLQRMAEG